MMTSSLHDRILARFDDQELRLFCADHFPEVNHEFTTGMRLSQMVLLLLEVCAHGGRGEVLLDALEVARPGLVGVSRVVFLADLDRLRATPPTPVAQKIINANIAQNVGSMTGGVVTGMMVNSSVTYVAPPPLPPYSPRHQLRAPTPDFQGRTEEITRIVTALQPAAGRSGCAISGLRGMGGIGKSELAFAAAAHLALHFPDAQIVLALRGAQADPLTPAQAVQEVIRAFEPEAKLPDDLVQLQALYRSLLAGKRVLVLADDARDAAQVRPLLPPPGSALLVTSRSRFTLPGMQALDLGTLPPDAAEALLLAICPRIGTHALALARLCGFLPLALRVSASLLAVNDTRDVGRYLTQLEAARLPHLRDPDGDPDDPEASVEASLALSYQALGQEEQAALCQVSVFPASFDRAAAEAVVAGVGDVEATLGSLRRRSVVERDAGGERYDLHDLVRAFAAARLTNPNAVRLRHARHYLAVAKEAQDNRYRKGDQLGGLALFDRERAHIDAGWAWALAHAGEAEADDLLDAYAGATGNIGMLRYDVRRERIPRLEAVLAVARRLGRRGSEGAWLGNLGLAYAALGDVQQAITYYEQHLAITREVGDRRSEGQALNNVGTAYRVLGDARRAITFYEQALAIAREVGDRQGEGSALGGLGNAYTNLGDAQKAITYHEQDLAITREVGDRHGEGQALNNVGTAYRHLGDARRAIPFYEQWLAIAREVGDRHGEGQALGSLGLACRALGDARRAITFYELALAIAHEVGDRRGEGQTLGSMGNAYANLGGARQALTSYEQALAIAHEVGDLYGAAKTSWSLGLAYVRLGDTARAIEAMQRCVDFEREIGHPNAEADAAAVAVLRMLQGSLIGRGVVWLIRMLAPLRSS